MRQSVDTFFRLMEEVSSRANLSKKDADLDSEAKAYLKKQQAIIKEIEDKNKNRYKYANQFIRISYLSLIFVGCMVVADEYEGIRFDLAIPYYNVIRHSSVYCTCTNIPSRQVHL